ncbi:MAG TPA: hypothetical protein VFM24_00120, partial [Nitrospira sp.]|nr:hypothetical protein [Nitrospira sp.]
LDRLTWFCLAWFALYALVVGRLDANSFEPWIMALLPAAILLSLFVFDPCARAPERSLAPLVLVAALFAHNAAAMVGIHSSTGDAFRAKNAWLIDNATPGDLVVTPFRNFQFESFTLYHVPADLISIQRHGLEEVRRRIAAVQAAGGRVFAYDDLFEDLEILAARDPVLAAATESWVERLSSRSIVVAENDAGKLYQIGLLLTQ